MSSLRPIALCPGWVSGCLELLVEELVSGCGSWPCVCGGFPSLQPLAATSLLSMVLPILDTSCKWNHAVFGPLCLASFTQRSVCKSHPHCSMRWYLSPFYNWMAFCCVNGPHYVYPLVDGLLGGFYFLALMNNAAVKIHVWVFVRHMFSYFLGIYIPRSGIVGHIVTHMFNY